MAGLQSFDGFRPEQKDAFVGYDETKAGWLYDVVERLGRRLHVEVDGLERLPAGRAVLVANHAFGWDVAFALARIHALTGRRVWVLGEHLWWRLPALRGLAAAVGVVDGTPENADRILQADELLLVLPGGLREAVKPRELRYRLLWGHRYGFIRCAIRAQAPLVPLAALGADELFDFTGDAYARGRRLHASFPIPLPLHILPHRVSLRYVLGEPIPVPGPAAIDDTDLHKRLRHEVEGALHELIEDELSRRVGIAL